MGAVYQFLLQLFQYFLGFREQSVSQWPVAFMKTITIRFKLNMPLVFAQEIKLYFIIEH